MVRKHIKRLSAPKSWPLGRKERTWVTRPKPSRSFDLAISLNNVLKDLMKFARTSKEVRYLIREVGVEVNGKRCHDFRRAVGLLDTVSIPSENTHIRIGISKKGRLVAVDISAEDAKKRVVKILNKTRVQTKTQLNCTDSSNYLVEKDTYKVGDSLLVEGNKILKHLPLKKEATILLTSGSHLSDVGLITDIQGRVISFQRDDEVLTTARKCAFVVGEKEPEVKIR